MMARWLQTYIPRAAEILVISRKLPGF